MRRKLIQSGVTIINLLLLPLRSSSPSTTTIPIRRLLLLPPIFVLAIFGVLTHDATVFEGVAAADAASRQSACGQKCNRLETVKGFENCWRQCNNDYNLGTVYNQRRPQLPQSNPTKTNRTYPGPPKNVEVILGIDVVKNRKYIRAKVVWDAPNNDPKREKFYLSFRAQGIHCEQLFPGYFSQNIPSSNREWIIPNQALEYDDELTLQYGCSYRVEMHSMPYPYGKPEYSALVTFRIGDCVQGFCNCRTEEVVKQPKNVRIHVHRPSTSVDDENDGRQNIDERKRERVSVLWDYYNLQQQLPDDAVRSRQLEFHVELADLLRDQDKPPWKRLFRWRQNVDLIQPAHPSQQNYSVDLPPLETDKDYKLKVYTLDKHVCRSKQIFLEFKLNGTTITPHQRPPALNHVSHDEGDIATANTINDGINTREALSSESAASIALANTNDVELTAEIEINDRVSKTSNANNLPVSKSNETAAATSSYTTKVVGWPYILLAAISLLLLLLVTLSFCILYRNRKLAMKKKYNNLYCNAAAGGGSNNQRDGLREYEANVLYTEKEVADAQADGRVDAFEVAQERIVFGRVLGRGAFGCVVYLGTAEAISGQSGTTTVAIKQLKAVADHQEREEFLSEIDMMKRVGQHPNIVSMLGCVTLSVPMCMIMEYVPHGDLQQYLRNLRKEYEKAVEEYRESLERDYVMRLSSSRMTTSVHSAVSGREYFEREEAGENGDVGQMLPFADEDRAHMSLEYSLDPIELQSFACQVAQGMAFLESMGVTHRDLAARNILVGHGKVLKISDFGLSRVGVYVKTTSGRIPLRWLSIEAMRENVYSTASDVWSYAVVLWEICTLGGFPYPSISDKDLLRSLEDGYRLEKPISCSSPVYDLMLDCWNYWSRERPSFSNILTRLNVLAQADSPYVQFINTPLPPSQPHPSTPPPPPPPTS